MSEPFIGEIRMFAGNFAPVGWAFCNGQLLSISQNTALFSLLGTTYGGNGTTTFALPDLQGRVPIGMGAGPGLTPRQLGEEGGTERLSAQQLPSHSHNLNAVSAQGSSNDPSLKLLARGRDTLYAPASGTPVVMSQAAVTGGGSSTPAEAMPPYLGMNYIIALQGIYPARS